MTSCLFATTCARLTALAPPQGLVGETYLRVRLLRLPPNTAFNPALYLSPAHFYEMRGFYQSDHFYFLDHAGHRYYLPQRRVVKRRRAKK